MIKIELSIPDESSDDLTDYLMDYLEKEVPFYTVTTSSTKASGCWGYTKQKNEKTKQFTKK